MPTRRHDAMRQAARLAEDSVLAGGGPFGAVVVRDGAVVGRGSNRVTLENDPTAHAEIVAIRRACAALGRFTLAGCELYTTCEPCPMCLGAILWARLDRVWFGNTRADAAAIGFDDAAFYDEVARPLEARTLAMTPFARELCLPAFALWDRKDDKTPY